MRAASWDCHRSVLRNDTHAGRTLDPTARSEPIRCGKEYIAFRCRLKAAVPCGKKLWKGVLAGECRGGRKVFQKPERIVLQPGAICRAASSWAASREIMANSCYHVR